MSHTQKLFSLAAATLVAVGGFVMAMPEANAGPKNSRDVTRTNAHDNVNRNNNTNVNRNTNVNTNRNVNVNTNRNVNVNVDTDYNRHPIGTAVAVGATVAVTAAVVGSIVNTVPANCVPVQMGPTLYQQCGSTWYQPQYVGTNVQYVVVAPLR